MERLQQKQVICVEGKPAYELENYLGGGVAVVVYEGHLLLPMEDYPVRLGINDRPSVITVQGHGGGGESLVDRQQSDNINGNGAPPLMEMYFTFRIKLVVRRCLRIR